MKETSRTTRY